MYISSKPARIIIAIPKSIKLLPNIIFFIMLFLHNFKLSLVYLSNLNGTTFPTTRPTKYTITLLCKSRLVIYKRGCYSLRFSFKMKVIG